MEIAKMNDLFEEAMENLGFDGYVIPDGLNPVPGLNRRKKAYGLCSRKYNRYEQRFDYEITFSKYFSMGCTEKQFKFFQDIFKNLLTFVSVQCILISMKDH